MLLKIKNKIFRTRQLVKKAQEDLDALKQAIEASGYKSRKDAEGVIQALEGANLKNSIGHPQGDKIIRKEDHSGILDHYISRIEKGRFEVKKRIPKEDLAKKKATASQKPYSYPSFNSAPSK